MSNKSIQRVSFPPKKIIVLCNCCCDESLMLNKLTLHLSVLKVYRNVSSQKDEVWLKTEVEKVWAERKVLLFDIDVKGAFNLKKMYGDDCLTIFIAPPTKEALIARLKNRGSEDAKDLKTRIKRFEEELAFAEKFDKIVVNKDFDTAYMRVKNLVIGFLKPQTQHIH